MTLNEFKAWLKGFQASINEVPTKEQWEAILNTLGTVRESTLPSYPSPIYPRENPNLPWLERQVTCRDPFTPMYLYGDQKISEQTVVSGHIDEYKAPKYDESLRELHRSQAKELLAHRKLRGRFALPE